MRASEFKGKTVILYYRDNQITEAENPTAIVLDEVEGFGLYVELEDGSKEVVAFSELTGWCEVEVK
ncbi:hypothetical protein PP175_26365 (plasmid) [Aneurinibacillus sp. Ricciae_BoGa-3]|uniref:hypothetical protein n=1 Tax=Aneurinibacillus sp. Ricciae_BoGa-3 TaxID=3022697 RepID=UPI00233F9FB6|nr:hypothetical protein [Aneurinibacillus sp. Ricciae_BoGa-3]WCK57592.1 hypothetical protein PP175_26365 [Aneurinibacillus sp. Ricciae_BoGa-3]